MRILFLDTKPNNPNRYISRALFSALRRHAAATEVVWASYVDALDLALEQSFDAFIAFGGEEAHNPVVQRICRLVPKRIVWFTEDPYETYRNRTVAEDFDLVFTNDAASVRDYGGKGRHLPLAGDRDSQFLPVLAAKTRYDLFFAGTAWPNRLKFLSELRKSRPDLKLKTVLVSNPAIDPYISEYRDAFDFSAGVSIRDFCRLANQSLLTLTLPRQFSTDEERPTAASDTPGPRLFEIALAGSCQLVDAGTTPHVKQLFDDGRHFLSFASMAECESRIGEALASPERIRQIARSAQAHCLERHLYDHRADDLMQALQRLPAREIATAPASRRRRVLFITHNIVEQGHFGGAEIYLDTALKNIQAHDTWVLTAHHDSKTYRLLGPDGKEIEQVVLPAPMHPGDLTQTELEQWLARILSRYAFDIVHINHLLRFPFSLPHVIQAHGAKIVFSLHDYFAICDVYTLIGFEGHYCDIPNRPPETCDVCLERTRNIAIGSQARRIRFIRESFRHIDTVLAGSRTSADIFTSMFPQLVDKVTLLPPPMLHDNVSLAPRLEDFSVLNVALLGNFTNVKGAEAVIEVFERAKDLPVTFHIFGRIDPAYADRLEALEASIVAHGQYRPGELPQGLAACDVFLMLSPWPETYCIALSEAQSYRLVPIVTTLGAQQERVIDGVNGFHVAPNDVQSVVDILSRLSGEPARLREMASRLPTSSGSSPADFVNALEKVYAGLTQGRGISADISNVRRYFSLDELNVTLISKQWITAYLPTRHLASEQAVVVAPTPPSVAERWLVKLASRSVRFLDHQILRARYARELIAQVVIVTHRDGVRATLAKIRHWFKRRWNR